MNDRVYYRDPGRLMAERELIADMTFPVRCTHCGRLYDLGKVEVTARYLDCSVWRSPCCRLTVDDRGSTGWKTLKDYVELDRNTGTEKRDA